MDDGWYAGILVGDASNVACKDNVFEGSGNGFNLDLRAGYQFNSWFGIRSGLSLMSKAYGYDVEAREDGLYFLNNRGACILIK